MGSFALAVSVGDGGEPPQGGKRPPIQVAGRARVEVS